MIFTVRQTHWKCIHTSSAKKRIADHSAPHTRFKRRGVRREEGGKGGTRLTPKRNILHWNNVFWQNAEIFLPR